MVYVDGKPVIVDAGVETYTRKTFSPQRYEIWTMQSAYHSLPTIDGVMQAPGRGFAARDVRYEADDASAQLTLDIAAAYPPEAKLGSWRRTVALHRGQEVEIVDAYDLSTPVGEIALSLLTPCQVGVDGQGQIVLSEALLAGGRRAGTAWLLYDAKLEVSVEEIPIEDERLAGVWDALLRRIVFRAANPPEQDIWTLKIVPLQQDG